MPFAQCVGESKCPRQAWEEHISNILENLYERKLYIGFLVNIQVSVSQFVNGIPDAQYPSLEHLERANKVLKYEPSYRRSGNTLK